MKRIPRSPLLALALVAGLVPPLHAAQDYFQGWDVAGDEAGWVANTISADVTQINCCGNPGGFINSFPINSTFSEIGITSDLPEVSGDYAAAGVTGVSFDIFAFEPLANLRFRVRYLDSTFNGWSKQVAASQLGGWQSYSIAFDPTWTDAEAIAAGWVFDGAPGVDFATTMSNVYHPEVRVLRQPPSGAEPYAPDPGLNGANGVGVDNFHLIADACDNDTVGPELTIALSRDVLWPPNHKLVEVCAEVSAVDNCDADPVIELVSVTSNEPDNGTGDGDTTGDIEILAGNCFKLRSERAGNGDGRKYTITYKATDASGNETLAEACVIVPHDRRGHALSASGFSASGRELLGLTANYEIFIASTQNVDAPTIRPDRVFVGNHLGILYPINHRIADMNDDRRADLVVTFDTRTTLDLIALTDADGPVAYGEAEDGGIVQARRATVSLYYEIAGNSYIVPDILKLPRRTLRQPGKEGGVGGGFAEVDRDGLAPGGDAMTLSDGGMVVVEVFNVQGRKVRTLVNGEVPAGTHPISWDGSDDSGRRVPGGVYFTRMIAAGIDQTRKVLVAGR